ncbi:MAG: carboxypeptidase regulatory-like domain-containing protein, partial [Polyangiales bacterium]
ASSNGDDNTLGGSDSSTATGDGGIVPEDDGGSGFDVSAEIPPSCTGLRCQQVKCDGGGSTTVTGTVYAPNGTLPLYNVIVYVPNSTPMALSKGASCDRCGAVASGDPIVTALTDSKGQFTLKDVPVGSDIPLVMQLGKWRRQIKIPSVAKCTETKLTDSTQTRLPKNRDEGDMPRIAVTTGAADKIACMLPKIGIDTKEFGPGNSTKEYAVEFYNGAQLTIGEPWVGKGPVGTPDATVLWDHLDKLKQYDMVIISCEGYEASTKAPPSGVTDSWPHPQSDTSYKAMTDYLSQGGRIFTTDFEYTWYKYSPDAALRGVGTIPGGAPIGASPIDLDTSFPKGKALADWLQTVEPTAPYAKLTCDYVFDNVSSVTKTASQTWATSGSPTHPRFFTINTPVGKPLEEQCGKAVHLDAHINHTDKVEEDFPAGCTAPIKQGEKAFAFFFFDLAACIQNEGEPPKAPPIK